MTSAAQSALRRGALPLLFFFVSHRLCPDKYLTVRIISHRAVHEERPVLHHLQLRQQNHPGRAVQVHALPVGLRYFWPPLTSRLTIMHTQICALTSDRGGKAFAACHYAGKVGLLSDRS